MTKRFILVAAIPLLALVACSTQSTSTPAPAPEPAAPDSALTDDSTTAMVGPEGERQQQQQDQQREVIRTASLTVIVADPEADGERVQKQAEDAGGYVANVSTGTPVPCRGSECPDGSSSGRSSGSPMQGDADSGILTITVRVPSARYDAVLDAIREMGEVATLSVNADDVTAQSQDLDARIRSQQASVDRVRQMMRQATTINELVRVEQELNQRQSDLESMLAQRKRLKDSVALATITATLVATDKAGEIIEPEEHWWDAPWNAFTEAWRALLIFLAAITPLIVLGVIALIVVLWFLRRRRRDRPQAHEPRSESTGDDEPQEEEAPAQQSP